MKKNKIDVLDGFGKLKPGKKVDVTDKTQKLSTVQTTLSLLSTLTRVT
jgi:dihydrolipoamide dehydrogenase